jgi:hypothetical protein
MKGPATTLWPRLLTGVFLTLLVREALAPARASASSCGDYVTVTNPANPSARHPMPVRPTPSTGQEEHDSPAPGEAPCHTPSCSGEPALPAPPVSSGRDVEQERWDCLVSLPPFLLTGALALVLVAPGLEPRRLPSAIFHPPRPR